MRRLKCGFYSLIKNRDPSYKPFPNVIGCIDCTHIGVDAKNVTNRERFRNRKDKITINVQAVCDPNLQFIDVVARWHGSVHNARIFDNSQLSALLAEGDYRGWLLGDSGYPQKSYLMTPIRDPISDAERRYNFTHCQVRNCIESAFGVLKRRFAVLGGTIRQSLDNSLNTIIACFVLHNFIRLRGDQGYADVIDTDHIVVSQDDSLFVEDEGITGLQQGRILRNEIVNKYFS